MEASPTDVTLVLLHLTLALTLAVVLALVLTLTLVLVLAVAHAVTGRSLALPWPLVSALAYNWGLASTTAWPGPHTHARRTTKTTGVKCAFHTFHHLQALHSRNRRLLLYPSAFTVHS